MALFDFLKPSKKKGAKGAKKTAKEKAEIEAAKRRKQAFSEGYAEYPVVEEEFKKQRFMVKYEKTIRALIWVGAGLLVALVILVIVLVIVRNLPGRDDDGDGILNTEDVCPGFDDNQDDDDDGIPNGCEEQPDSTDLSIVSTAIIPGGQDRYDVALEVINPNDEWGASPLEYSVSLLAADGSLINTSERARSYILPGQRRTLTAFNILAVSEPVSAELVVSFAEWIKVQNYVEPQFDTTTIEFEVVEEPGIYARLKGRVANRTTFTFDNVQTTILLRADDGSIAAINRTEIDTLQPGEERDFIVTFPQEIPDIDPANIEYETDVDVFRNDTFVSASVVQGQRFQQFTPQTPP